MLSPALSAQDYSLLIKRIVSYGGEDYYQKHILGDVFHLAGERSMDDWWSVGVECMYSNYHLVLPAKYDFLGSVDQFYDHSLAYGLYGRVYIGNDSRLKVFIEAGLQSNHTWINQPVVVKHYYGRYTEILQEQDWLLSETLAHGASLGSAVIRYEPYVRLTFSGEPAVMRGEKFMLASAGTLEQGGNDNWLIVPLSFRFMFPRSPE